MSSKNHISYYDDKIASFEWVYREQNVRLPTNFWRVDYRMNNAAEEYSPLTSRVASLNGWRRITNWSPRFNCWVCNSIAWIRMQHLKSRELSSVQLFNVACRSYCSIEYPHPVEGCVLVELTPVLKFGMIWLRVYSAKLHHIFCEQLQGIPCWKKHSIIYDQLQHVN